MSEGATVITPNNRLSNQLLADFYAYRSNTTCDKPHCMPYQSLLNDLFEQVCHTKPSINHPLLITHHQQRYLWRQILSKQTDYPCNNGLLGEVDDAWMHCKQWQLNMHDIAFANTQQTQQFQRWQEQFELQLKQQHCITSAHIVSYALALQMTFKYKHIIWACFDDYTPEQRALQEAFSAQGCIQNYYDLAPNTALSFQYQARDAQDEYLQLFHWLQTRLAAGDKRIGIVVPDLQTQGTQLQRLMQQHLPDCQFNISLGRKLTDIPLVAHALHWLQFNKQVISNHQARLLLHSPYLAGSKSEFITRTQTLEDCEILLEAQIPFMTAAHAFAKHNPILSTALLNLTDYPAQASPEHWIHEFKTRLTTFGFPGEYSLDSATYQCFQRFLTLFDEFRQFTLLTPIMSLSDALYTLQDLAQNTIFQIKQPKTPIQISGLLEASGCTFDSVWVCGLTDQCLPQKTNLSAFIPLDMQRTYQMPRANADRELQFAKQTLDRLKHGSQLSIYSFPHYIGDTPHLASPLITQYPILELTAITPITTNHLLQEYRENYLLPLTPQESSSGGTSLLANQAKCPFRAFAAHRLYAKTAHSISTGPNALERGQIIHRVMELLWQELGSQYHLLNMPTHELNERIEHIIIQALEATIQNRSLSFPKIIQEIEIARIKRLIQACLEWEKQRPPFKIDALEQNFTFHLAGLNLQVRVDRLDITEEDGTKWVIDYKSSIPANKPWNDERPEEPQLLLYALLDANINTLLFVQLNSGKLTCNGISENAQIIKGINALKKNERWSDYQEQWHHQLSDLANEFYTGHCPPTPTKSNTCSTCAFQNLCRIEL